MMQVLCEICGNEMDGRLLTCPYCGTRRQDLEQRQPRVVQKTVNLEQGMPTVRQALQRLRQELERSGRQRYRVLTLIHGYGSSGRGGAIRSEVRRELAYLKDQRLINDFLPGEEFSRRSGHGRQILRRFPFLSRHRDLNRSNEGITLVIL